MPAKLPCFIDGETRNSTQRLPRPAQPLPGPVHAAHALRAPATCRHAPPAATHSLVQCCHLSRGDSDSLFVSPLPPWPRARFQKELSKMQSGFLLVCEMLPGWPLPPWESVSSCRGGGRQGRGLPPRAHFPSVQSPGCLLPIPCVCHLPREALLLLPLLVVWLGSLSAMDSKLHKDRHMSTSCPRVPGPQHVHLGLFRLSTGRDGQ